MLTFSISSGLAVAGKQFAFLPVPELYTLNHPRYQPDFLDIEYGARFGITLWHANRDPCILLRVSLATKTAAVH